MSKANWAKAHISRSISHKRFDGWNGGTGIFPETFGAVCQNPLGSIYLSVIFS
jgi:hypothetical protein